MQQSEQHRFGLADAFDVLEDGDLEEVVVGLLLQCLQVRAQLVVRLDLEDCSDGEHLDEDVVGCNVGQIHQLHHVLNGLVEQLVVLCLFEVVGDGKEVLFDDFGVRQQQVLRVAFDLPLQELQELREVLLYPLQLGCLVEGGEKCVVEFEALLDSD